VQASIHKYEGVPPSRSPRISRGHHQGGTPLIVASTWPPGSGTATDACRDQVPIVPSFIVRRTRLQQKNVTAAARPGAEQEK